MVNFVIWNLLVMAMLTLVVVASRRRARLLWVGLAPSTP
jgi:hypothetical protein